MENDFTSLEDYNNGFLGGEAEGTASLLKAMQAGAITGRDTTDLALTAEPLKAESLERTIKLLEFRTKDIRLLNAMPKMVAYNTVEEFLQLQSYGADRGGFYNEGELSDVEDSTYVRRAELIKYIQVTGEITMQAQMVRSFIDVYRKEVENKTMWIMRRANSSMTSGNADVIPQEFNGLYRQHANVGTGGNDFLYASLEAYFTGGAVVDLRGASIKQKDVENGAIIVDNGFGNPTDLFAPNTVISALGVDYFQDQRILLDGKGVNGTFGTVPKAIDTSIGSINLSSDKFMKQKAARLLTDNATSPKAPGAPVTGGAPSVSASTLSKFVAGDAGSAYYAVSAINRYGESQLTLIDASAAAIIAGVRVDLTFTVGAGANPTSGYVIYRSKITTAATSAGVQFYPIFSVSTADLAAGYDGGGAGTVRDQGRFLPAMEQCFLTQMDEEVLSFKQLAPISKLDLAIISMSRRFIAFNFCTPNLYAPKKFVRYINVSPTVTPR